MAPFRGQQFRMHLEDLINIKYIVIDNYTHGSEMTISISDHEKYATFYSAESSPRFTRTSTFVRVRL